VVELAAADEFDHQVVNHDVGEAAQKVVDLMRPRKGRR
jgi:guanylate kinase